jgi:hypothetical protein
MPETHRPTIKIPPHRVLALPFVHISGSNPPIRFVFEVTDKEGQPIDRSEYVGTFDDPYGSGDMNHDNQPLPPVVFNNNDEELSVVISLWINFPENPRELTHRKTHTVDDVLTTIIYRIDDDSQVSADGHKPSAVVVVCPIPAGS